ncbi:histidine phosphatase family protein [Humidesulfovibrio idahonensis]
MAIVLLLRHGEIAQESPRRFVGQRDLPLTQPGLEQALRWQDVLTRTPLAGAWCSSLGRCRKTARLILEPRGLAATPVDALREISLGAWEGLSVEEVRQRFPGDYERRGADLAGTAPTGGESFVTAQQRAWAALEAILSQAEGTMLVVAHAGINRALICRMLGIPLARLFSLGQDYAAMNILEFTQGKEPVLRALNLPPQAAAAHPALPCA